MMYYWISIWLVKWKRRKKYCKRINVHLFFIYCLRAWSHWKIPEFRQNSGLSAEWFMLSISVLIKFKIQHKNSRRSYKFRWKRRRTWNLHLHPSLLPLLKMTSGSHFTGMQVFPSTQAIIPLVPDNTNFCTAYAHTLIPEGCACVTGTASLIQDAKIFFTLILTNLITTFPCTAISLTLIPKISRETVPNTSLSSAAGWVWLTCSGRRWNKENWGVSKEICLETDSSPH